MPRLGDAVERYQAAVDDFDREIARLMGVNETDLRCLEILLRDVQEAAPTQLATRLGLTTGSVTTMLDRLEKLGYLTRTPHPTDRRKTVVRATPEAARRAYELITPLVDDAAQTLLPRYTVEQLELIIDYLAGDADLQQRHTQRLRSIPTPRRAGNRAPRPEGSKRAQVGP